jgi:hypothetical protein
MRFIRISACGELKHLCYGLHGLWHTALIERAAEYELVSRKHWAHTDTNGKESRSAVLLVLRVDESQSSHETI